MNKYDEFKNNYSMRLYDKSIKVQLSVNPSYYDWVNDDTINQVKFLEWIQYIFKNYDIESREIGVKLKNFDALITFNKEVAEISYVAPGNDFNLKNELKKEYIHYSYLKIGICEDEVNEEDSFWNDPESCISKIEENIKINESALARHHKDNIDDFNKLNSKIKAFKTQNKLSMLLQSAFPDVSQLKQLLLDGKIKNIDYLQKTLEIIYANNYKFDNSVISSKEIYEKTYFYKTVKDIEDKTSFINLIFTNCIVHYSNIILFLYILKQLDNKFELLDSFEENLSLISNLLSEMRNKNDFTDIYKILEIYHKNKLGLFVSKKKFEEIIKITFFEVLNIVENHISSRKYLIIKPFNILFYDYTPKVAIRNFSRTKYAYINLEYKIYYSIKTRLMKYSSKIDIINALNRELAVEVHYEFTKSTENATRHIMNVFYKNFGTESLYETITLIIDEIREYILFEKIITRRFDINRILNNDINSIF